MVGNSAAFTRGSVNCSNTWRGTGNLSLIYDIKGYVVKQYKETLIKYSNEIRNTVKLTWFAVFSSGFS